MQIGRSRYRKSRRLFALCISATIFAYSGHSFADNSRPNDARVEAAKKRSEIRSNGVFDDSSTRYSIASIGRRASEPQFLSDLVAGELMSANIGREYAIVMALNDTALPFLSANRSGYMCLLIDHYLNSFNPDVDLLAVNESGEAFVFEYQFIFAGLHRRLQELDLNLPDHIQIGLYGDRSPTETTQYVASMIKDLRDCRMPSVGDDRRVDRVTGTSIDSERLDAAAERAVARWNELYATTPKRFTIDMLKALTSAEWEQTSRSARRLSYIEFIAYELSAFNPDKAIAAYLNTSLLPYLESHRDQYVCLLTEAYYHLSLTPEQIMTNSGHPLEILYDYAYLYGNTAAARAELDIFVDPDHYDLISPIANLNWRSEWAEIDLGCNS